MQVHDNRDFNAAINLRNMALFDGEEGLWLQLEESGETVLREAGSQR
jgi:transposase